MITQTFTLRLEQLQKSGAYKPVTPHPRCSPTCRAQLTMACHPSQMAPQWTQAMRLAKLRRTLLMASS